MPDIITATTTGEQATRLKRTGAREARQIALTPALARDLKFDPAERERTIYWDIHRDSVKGFALIVSRSGHRTYAYQYYAAGQYRRPTLGDARKLSLADARRMARGMQGDVARGGDPLDARRAEKAAREAARAKAAADSESSLRDVAEDYLSKACGMVRDAEGRAVFTGRLKSADQRLDMFERLVFPKLGDRKIGDIARGDMVELLDGIAKKKGGRTADLTLAYLSALFNWYAPRHDTFRSPIVRGMRHVRPKERARTRVLDDQEIRDLWAGLDAGYKAGDLPFCCARFIRMLLLTAVRRTEAADANWPEIISLDREDYRGEVLVIPAARMKSKLDHAVPMTPAVRALVGERAQDKELTGPFIFSTRSGKRPFSGFSKAKAALDKHIAQLREKEGREPMPAWVLHDLRRTAKTLMQRAGTRPDISERVLAHVIPGVEGVYDRYGYRPEKRDALDRLAAIVDRILKKGVAVDGGTREGTGRAQAGD